MLELRDICIAYENQTIYNHAYFYAHHNDLTLVIGKSGSGKTTLHKLMTFQDMTKCQYYYDNQLLDNLSIEQQKKFIKDKMGIVNQSPAFIDDLTINDHIGLCQSLWNGFDVDEYIERLEIKHIINEYPQQLSGGEKIRVSILLALIHQPEILVFDEPTASLDKHHTKIIVDILKEYAHQGHVVIIFTHDSLMKKEGDVVYEIKDELLDRTQQKLHSNIPEYLLSKKSSQHYIQYVYKMFLHKKTLKICMIGFVAFAIAMSSFSILYGYSVIDKYQQQLQEINKGGILYRDGNTNIRMFNNEAPIGSEEIQVINQINSIDNVWPHIINYNTNNEYDFKVFCGQDKVAQHLESDGYIYSIATYNDEYKYNLNDLKYSFDVDCGIYIDEFFLYYLMTGIVVDDVTTLDQNQFQEVLSRVDSNTEIEFPALISQYIEMSQNLQNIVYQAKNIKLKIKGIFSNSTPFQLCKDFNSDIKIFYPLSIEEQYRKEMSQKELMNQSSFGENMTRIDFQPMYYQFSIKDDYSFSEAKEGIEALGYQVSSEYYDMEVQVQIAKSLNEGILMVSLLIMCVVLMMLFGMKYNQKKEYCDFMNFFTNRGLTNKKAKQILNYYFMYEAMICAIMSCVLMALIVFVYYYFMNSDVFVIRISFFVFCIVLSFVIEVGIPQFVIGDVKK